MGFLPIVVAFGGFGLLWAVLVYNNLKGHVFRMRSLRFTLQELAVKRDNMSHPLADELRQQYGPTEEEEKLRAVPQKVLDPTEAITPTYNSNTQDDDRHMAYIGAIEQIAEKYNKAVANPDKWHEALRLKEDIAHTLKDFYTTRRDYNSLIKKAPSKFVARAFGFKEK